ncbi:hypothetical protein BY996DRAFT_4635646 [Phakopsora pachyrhizi]|uniref:CNH domain-containing protein n=1 Tax=Phakopsora pachyrhizi TaxID=170000 RepID=A0AAV0BJK3_PHAPC|nr:hypothetical protein BY996DRAFT_4635646 [Phakopsora pachyrhizi]CAH7687428.1 hypothetical protein PPACK8108_LOCUS22205 [Phakopsora pachyrhizi]
MHEAFGIETVVDGLKSHAPTSLFVQSDQLLMGCDDGSLQIYSIISNDRRLTEEDEEGADDDENHRSDESIIKETNSVIVLSGGDITFHDLNSLDLQSSCEKWTKLQASSMCLETAVLWQNQQVSADDNSQKTPEIAPNQSLGIPVLITLLAVPCKRRLVLFAWRDGEWLTPKEVSLPHQVRSLTFATPLKLFLGYSTGDYSTLKINIPSDRNGAINHEISEAFQSPITPLVGKFGDISQLSGSINSALPSSALVPSSKLSGFSGLGFKTSGLAALGLASSSKVARNPVVKVGPPTYEVLGIKEHLATFMNYDGKLSRPQSPSSITSNVPSSILYSASPVETFIKHPYVLSVLPSTVSSASILSVHSVPTLSHIQNLEFPSSVFKPQSEVTPNSSPSKRTPDPSNHRAPGRRLLTTSSHSSRFTFLVATEWCMKEKAMIHHIECLMMRPWAKQLEQLIDAGEYEDSLGLIENLDELSLPKKTALTRRLQALCAVLKFSKHAHNQAMDCFISLSINPAKVIALYPRQISGKLARRREEWEHIFGGRTAESYFNKNSSTNASSLTGLNDRSSQPSSEHGSVCRLSSSAQHGKRMSTSPLPNDDDRGSIKSFRSPQPSSLKAKSSQSSIQNIVTDATSQDTNFKPSVDVLIRYLTDRRQNVNKKFARLGEMGHLLPNLSSTGGNPSIEQLKKTKLLSPLELFQFEDLPITEITDLDHLVQIAKIIDTSLFKCYLAIKPTMLGPLCRLPNWCESDEVETLLTEAKRHRELLDLYHGKGQHDRALKLLKKMGESEEDLELKIDPTIRYLQKLGSDYLSLIFEASKWIFSTSSDSLPMTRVALEIFTADLSTVESLPRSEVVEFLERQSLIACLLYLEHLIHGLNDRTPTFHEKLIHVYIIEFKRLRSKGDLDDARETYEKLLNHLYSPYYSPNWVLGRLPADDMYEARALTLGRMGQHDAALSIYVYRLSNIRKAEDYCKRVYSSVPEMGGRIFLSLLKVYLRPNTNLMTGSTSNNRPKEYLDRHGVVEEEGFETLNSKELLDSALKLISDHGNKIEQISEVLELLPSLISLEKLKTFIMKSFRSLKQNRRETIVLRECYRSRLDDLDLGLRCLEDRRVKIEDKRLCVGCGKRLGNSAIAVHPPYGEVTHYQCRGKLSNSERRL